MRMYGRLPLVLSLSVASWIFIFGSATCSLGQTLAEVRDSAARNASRLISTSYESTIKNSAGAERHYRFARNGAKFMVDRMDVSPTILAGNRMPLLDSKSVFDGAQYRILDRRSGLLKQSSKRMPMGGADPFLEMHGWLLFGMCMELSWSSLQDHDVWMKRFVGAKPVGYVDFGAKRCLAIEFPQDCIPRECVYRVYFLKAEEWFPLGYERFDKASGARSTLFRIENFDLYVTQAGPVAFPSRITYDENGADGVSFVHSSKIALDPDKIDLNTQHDAGVFSISTEEIEKTYDVQAQKAAFDDMQESIASFTETMPQSFRQSSRWLIWVNAGVAIALIAWIFLRGKVRSGNAKQD